MNAPRATLAAAATAVLLWLTPALAGPPYTTDDPEPVDYQHWEFYLASQHFVTRDAATGTAPHVEVNYGVLPDVQLHAIAPVAYARSGGGPTFFGPGDIELGTKVRFVQEGDWCPMVGTFPHVELPVGDATRGLGAGHLQTFIPVWLQKSFGPWTTYGGGGYWVNRGDGHRDYWSIGWLVQRRVSDLAAVGTEVFYTTPDHVGGGANLEFNVGLILDLSEHHHLLVSAGRGIIGDNRFQAYAAYQLTL